MKPWIRSVVCLICIVGAVECWSQEISEVVANTAVATATDMATTTANPLVKKPETELPSTVVTGRGTLPLPATTPRIADRKYFFLNGLHAGMAVLDVEMTQHCIAAKQCREANPVMPSSHAGQLSVNFALVAYESWFSYWLKKHHPRVWWVPPLAGTVVHSAGVVTGVEHY